MIFLEELKPLCPGTVAQFMLNSIIAVDTDVGLLIESFYILPFIVIIFYFITKNGLNDFSLSNLQLSLFLILAGPMTVIPLFLYVRGVELIGLGASGLIFYITPETQGVSFLPTTIRLITIEFDAYSTR